jgi:sulfite exporter TauE/SafE
MSFIAEAFMLGLAYGFGPCMTSCAPLLVPIIMSSSRSTKEGLINTLLMGAGRIVSYVVLGVLFALLGKVIEIRIPDYGMGILYIALGLIIIFRFHMTCPMPKKISRGGLMCFVSGIALGFSPCAPMLGMLALSANSGSVVTGAFIAGSFGLATAISPLILIGLIAGKWSSLPDFRKMNHIVSGGFLILMSLFYFL